jgi:SAM-dependent methyltransferase
MTGDDADGRGDGNRGASPDREGGNHAAVQSFYGQWAGLYDAIAKGFPRIGAVRRRAVDACRLEPGDTVVEMGCGTGANLGYLREAVGPTGRVVGVDVTRPMLDRARKRYRDDDTVHLVHGDAATPPVDGPVDAVLATFVSGMFRDPAGVVHGWCDLVGDGHVVLVDAGPSRRASAKPLNAAFRAATVLSTPPTLQFRYDEDVTGTLDRRVSAAHGVVRERSSALATAEHLLGFVRLTGGRIG